MVNGPAGSGKTKRHFQSFFNSKDCRLDKDVTAYVTMTNYLAQKMKKEFNIRCFTNFKAFNRRPCDEANHEIADKRFDPTMSNKMKFHEHNPLQGISAVFVDEVTMISPKLVYDIMHVCRAYKFQLFLCGDFDNDRFYQLSAVNEIPDTFFSYLDRFQEETGLVVNFLPQHQVYRQIGDAQLSKLISDVRNINNPSKPWMTLYNNDMFRHTTYSVMMREMDPSKDLVVCTNHHTIRALTKKKLEMMGEDDVLQARCFPKNNVFLKPEDPEFLNGFLVDDEDKRLYRGAMTKMTKSQLQSLKGTKFMSVDYPYAVQTASKLSENIINPMIGTTVFNLQGLTMEGNSTLYMVHSGRRAMEWMNKSQANQVYVVLSRIRDRNQLVLVCQDEYEDQNADANVRRRVV